MWWYWSQEAVGRLVWQTGSSSVWGTGMVGSPEQVRYNTGM